MPIDVAFFFGKARCFWRSLVAAAAPTKGLGHAGVAAPACLAPEERREVARVVVAERAVRLAPAEPPPSIVARAAAVAPEAAVATEARGRPMPAVVQEAEMAARTPRKGGAPERVATQDPAA
jgi:hypothetical protein